MHNPDILTVELDARAEETPETQYQRSLLLETGEQGLTQNLDEARRLLTLSAAQGYEPAKTRLESQPETLIYAACLYNNGSATSQIKQDNTEAIRLLTLATAQGHGHAAYILSLMYSRNENNMSASNHWLTRSAGLGDAKAQYDLGVAYLAGKRGFEKNETEANRLLRLSHIGGYLPRLPNDPNTIHALHAETLFGFAHGYHLGTTGLTQNDSEAIRFYHLAAEKNHTEAAFCLSTIWKYGCKQDMCESNRLLAIAANLGHPQAQYTLGMSYLNGADGFEANPVMAEQYLKKATQQGNEAACKVLEEIQKKPAKLESVDKKSQDEQSLEEAFRHLETPDATSMNIESLIENTLACTGPLTKFPAETYFQLARAYEYGTYTHAKNETKAVKWYQKAADLGHAEAAFCLSHIYKNGKYDCQADLTTATQLLWKSAELGYPQAQYELGLLNINGEDGFGKNMEMGKAFLKKAAAQDMAEAIDKLKFLEIAERISVLEKKPQTKKQSLAQSPETPIPLAQASHTPHATSQRLQNKREQDAERKKKQEEAQKIAQMKAASTQPKTKLLDCLQALIRDISQKRSEISTWTSSTDQKSFEYLKTSIIAKIKDSTDTLERPLTGKTNFKRPAELKYNLQCIKTLSDLTHIPRIIQDLRQEMNTLEQLSQILQKEKLNEEAQGILAKVFPEFLQIPHALAGALDDLKKAQLEIALSGLKKKQAILQAKYTEVSDSMKQLEKLHEQVVRKKLETNKYKYDPKNAGTLLTTEQLEGIANDVKEIRAILATLSSTAQQTQNLNPQQQPQPDSPLSARNRVLFAQSTVTAAHLSSSTPAVDTESQKMKSSKQERQDKCQARRREIIKAAKRAAEAREREFHRLRTESELETTERKPNKKSAHSQNNAKDPKCSFEKNPLLKLQLERLDSIIKILTVDSQSQSTLPTHKIYALLGSLAQVCEVLKNDNTDPAISQVSRHLRNAIFKQYESLETAIGCSGLLKAADQWYNFLLKQHPGTFDNEEAVLKDTRSGILRRIYNIGKGLALISAKNIDLEKSRQSIQGLQTYWKSRETQLSESDEIKSAAEAFYWGVLSSELVLVVSAKRAGRKEAGNIVKELSELMLYFSEIRDRGVVARHPISQDEWADLLQILESKNDTLSSNGDAESSPLIFSRSIDSQAKPLPDDGKEQAETCAKAEVLKVLNGEPCELGLFKTLLAGTQANTKGPDGRTLLRIACENCDCIPPQFIQALLEQDANPNEDECVALAVVHNKKDILELFIANKKKPVEKETWTSVKELCTDSEEMEEMLALITQAETNAKTRAKSTLSNT